MNSGIRKIKREDLVALKSVLDSIDLFPAEMLDDMIADYFNNAASQAIWFTKIEDGMPISIGFCAPEQLTDGTYNLYAIGVQKEYQGKGIGKEMMAYIENELRSTRQRILLVETSSSAEMALTREFYVKCKYTQEAVIRDFWQEGEDKVIFWKKLK